MREEDRVEISEEQYEIMQDLTRLRTARDLIFDIDPSRFGNEVWEKLSIVKKDIGLLCLNYNLKLKVMDKEE